MFSNFSSFGLMFGKMLLFLQASVLKGFQEVTSSDKGKLSLFWIMECLIATLNVLLLLGPTKLTEAMGKGQNQSSPDLGHELEFHRTSRHAAVAATSWIRSMTTL